MYRSIAYNGQALPKAVHSTACGNAVLVHVLFNLKRQMETEATCKHCGERLWQSDIPEDRTIVTVFGFQLVLRRWVKSVEDCPSCRADRRQAWESEAYHQAFSDGYLKRIDDEGY